ncbi:MAG: hypothetical protein R3F43_01205 [bacterium]
MAARLLAAIGIEAGAGIAEGYLADGTRLHVAFNAAGGPAITLDRPRAAPDLASPGGRRRPQQRDGDVPGPGRRRRPQHRHRQQRRRHPLRPHRRAARP